ncbi:MAG: zinc-binding dehydrogenase [Anaerolineae bacterium]|nr:zinc-binding dehydrogenase [Anaerolineae bacterium]
MERYRGKAVAFVRPRRAELRDDVLFPRMDEEGVVIRTEYSVISRGTELDLYTNQMHGRGERAQWYPLLPGYMPCGSVIAVGSRVTHLQVGDRAVGSNLLTDFDERYCCAWGGHCEYVVVSRHSHPALGAVRAVKVPDSVPTRYAPLAVLGAVALHGVRKQVRPLPGETVLVVGQGVIGNMAAQLCRLAGARVIVADLVETRLAVARRCGSQETINASQEPLAEGLRRLTGGAGPESIIDTTGEPRLLEQLLHLARVGGRVHAQGMYLEPVSIYIPETLFGRNLSLSATAGERPEHVAEILSLMADGCLIYEPLLSEVLPVSAATEAYELVHNHPEQVVTVALQW